MCGITGIFSRRKKISQSLLEVSAERLEHRGPDDTGFYINNSFGMAHTRLSIIDLEGGHQPLADAENNILLVANGEIYNHIELRKDLEKSGHIFSTHSDCEVILHAYVEYGSDFIDQINGMFAFALYDKRIDRLIIARDRLGIKPLFLAHLPDGLAFASEIKALLPYYNKIPDLNPAALVQYLQNQFSTNELCLFNSIERILPGEILHIEKGSIRNRWQYWSPLKIKPKKYTFNEAQEHFNGLFETVVKQHMRSDVPFGLFLSGGVDSSLILALLSRYKSEPIRTFSVGFSGTSVRDELPTAGKTAALFGAQHTEIKPDREQILNSLPFTVWAADDLICENANLPTALLARTAGKELKVVFTGEGGDEAFAGYGRYKRSIYQRFLRNLKAPGSGGYRTKKMFNPHWENELFSDTLRGHLDGARKPYRDAWKSSPKDWSDITKAQYLDIANTFTNNHLVKIDRMLMASSVEGRVPFVDHRIVEFGLSLPNELKIKSHQGKIFLKRWAMRYLPEDLLFARKRGFAVPVTDWINGEFLDQLRKTLPNHTAIRNWFRPQGVNALLKKGGTDSSINHMIWMLLQFAVWYEIFLENNGARPADFINPINIIT